MTSALLIIPAPLRDAANAVGAAMGWGPNNYDGISLSNDGGATVTHWACRVDVELSFLHVLFIAEYDLTNTGLSIEEIETVKAMTEKVEIPLGADKVLNALDVNFSNSLWGSDHLQSVIVDKKLTMV